MWCFTPQSMDLFSKHIQAPTMKRKIRARYTTRRPLSFYTRGFTTHTWKGFEFLARRKYLPPIPPSSLRERRASWQICVDLKKVLIKTAIREKEYSKYQTKQKKYSECYVLPHVTGRLNEHRTYINLLQLFWKNKKMLQKQRVKLFAKTKP